MSEHGLSEDLRRICLPPGATARQAMQVLEEQHRGIALVVDEGGRLLGTITDGDLRRSMLRGLGSEDRADAIMQSQPICGRPQMSRREISNLMNRPSGRVQQLPIVTEDGIVRDVVFLSDLLQGVEVGTKAVVMAGGDGTRLRPLTFDTPKPLLPVAGKPIAEIIVEQLLEAGFEEIFLVVHYKAEMIERHFRQRDFDGGQVHCVRESEPSGTAGGLRLVRDQLDGPFILMNADILTRLSFRQILEHQTHSQAAMTVAVKHEELQIPYGVVTTDDAGAIREFAEKPVMPFMFNIGIYALEARALEYLPESGRCDITELIQTLLDNEELVDSFRVDDYWMDIGRLADYEKACDDVQNNRF